MTLSTLDRQSALIVIDLQKGIVGRPLSAPVEPVIANAAKLAAAFRANGLPVVLVNVDGGAPGRTETVRPNVAPPADWAELVPELGRAESDILVTKRTWGAFTNTDLAAQLKARGVTQIVLAGVATSIGVETTAREGYALGFNVALATDAMTDLRPGAHDHSIAVIFPRLGESGTTADILALLDGGPAR